MNPDIVNGLFEFIGALFVFNHCRVLNHDKCVKGVSIVSTVFFTLWGVWNLYYYPSLSQLWSFIGGLVLVGANMCWIALMIQYRKVFENYEK